MGGGAREGSVLSGGRRSPRAHRRHRLAAPRPDCARGALLPAVPEAQRGRRAPLRVQAYFLSLCDPPFRAAASRSREGRHVGLGSSSCSRLRGWSTLGQLLDRHPSGRRSAFSSSSQIAICTPGRRRSACCRCSVRGAMCARPSSPSSRRLAILGLSVSSASPLDQHALPAAADMAPSPAEPVGGAAARATAAAGRPPQPHPAAPRAQSLACCWRRGSLPPL